MKAISFGLAVLLVLVSTVAAQPQTTEVRYHSGSDLTDWCASHDPVFLRDCRAYLVGMVNALYPNDILVCSIVDRPLDQCMFQEPFCWPYVLSGQRISRAVLDYLARNQDKMGEPAPVIVLQAMRERYPPWHRPCT